MYAPASVATCVQASVGDQAVTAVHNIDQCTTEDYVTGETGGVASGAADWMMVGCFVSDQDGQSHADPWASGDRWVEDSWEGCRQRAITENTAMFVMEYGQGYATQGHASCGHVSADIFSICACCFLF